MVVFGFPTTTSWPLRPGPFTGTQLTTVTTTSYESDDNTYCLTNILNLLISNNHISDVTICDELYECYAKQNLS